MLSAKKDASRVTSSQQDELIEKLALEGRVLRDRVAKLESSNARLAAERTSLSERVKELEAEQPAPVEQPAKLSTEEAVKRAIELLTCGKVEALTQIGEWSVPDCPTPSLRHTVLQLVYWLDEHAPVNPKEAA